MKRVLHVTKRFPPYIGGIETNCQNIADALSNDYEQLILAFNDKDETVEENFPKYKLIRASVYKVIASQPLSRDYGKLMKKAIGEFKPDIIHFDYPNPYAAHYLLKYIKKFKCKAKFQLYWHMDIIKQKAVLPLFKPQIKKLLKIADQIVVTSPNYMKNTTFLPDYVGKKTFEIIPSRIGDERTNLTPKQLQKADEIKKEHQNKKIVFFFGRHVKYKGLTYLIEANKYIDRSKVDIVIGGSGPLTEELKEQAKEFGNVFFLGRLSDDDINSYLYACDIFAFPSITRNEAYGISLAEALYFGKPALTFTIPGSGVNFVNLDGVTGLEAPNSDAKQLGINLDKLVNDEKLYAKLSEGAKNRAKEYFVKEVYDKKTLEVYSKL